MTDADWMASARSAVLALALADADGASHHIRQTKRALNGKGKSPTAMKRKAQKKARRATRNRK